MIHAPRHLLFLLLLLPLWAGASLRAQSALAPAST